MSRQIKRFYEFGNYRIDTVNRRLLRDGETVPLKAKVVDTLLLLIERKGEVVEKDELMKELWPDSFVEEANLTQNIYMLRKAFGEAQYIETIPRRGYRFAAAVKEWADPSRELLIIREKTTRSLSYEDEVQQAANDQLDLPAAHARQFPTRFRLPGRLRVLVSIAIVAGALAMLALVIFWPRKATVPFAAIDLVRFTTSGKAEKAAISTDGKYLGYVLVDAGRSSLRLQQIATGKDLELIPPSETEFYGLTFSHDGNYIYYVSQQMNRLGMLFQIPSLGGPANKLAEDVDSTVTMAPDDKSLAFIRLSPAERSIIVLNVDGSGERKLASTSTSAQLLIEPSFLVPPAWSPDGRIIACPVGIANAEDEYQTIWGFETDTGKGSALTSEHWQMIGKMYWPQTGNGIVIAAVGKSGNFTQQIWHVSYPDGAVRKITNDLSDYRDLSVTADARTIVAVQSERRANLWVAAAGDLDHPRQLTATNYDGLDGLAWTPDGKIVYTQQSAGEQNLWITDLNGNNSQLTKQAGFNLEPAVSADGRYVVFTSSRAGRLHIWRIDIDGKHPLELTHGSEDRAPSLTVDSQSVFFRSYVYGGGAQIFRVSIDGGEPVRVTEKISGSPSISPDGKSLALIYREAPAAINKFAIMNLDGSATRLICDLPAHFGQFRWLPEGTALAYAAKREGVGNIWLQPVGGGAPRQLTHWRPDPILAFDWSRDGKWLAYASASLTSDVVRIRDLQR